MPHPPRPTVEWVLTIDTPFTDAQVTELFDRVQRTHSERMRHLGLG